MKRHWEPHELIEDWTLLPAELELLANKTGATRLGFALLLKYFQIEGRFPHSKHDIPKAVLPHVARQVGVPVDQYLAYDWRGRSIKAHRAQIRTWLGFREATVEDAEQLVSWLCDEVLLGSQHIHSTSYAIPVALSYSRMGIVWKRRSGSLATAIRARRWAMRNLTISKFGLLWSIAVADSATPRPGRRSLQGSSAAASTHRVKPSRTIPHSRAYSCDS